MNSHFLCYYRAPQAVLLILSPLVMPSYLYVNRHFQTGGSDDATTDVYKDDSYWVHEREKKSEEKQGREKKRWANHFTSTMTDHSLNIQLVLLLWWSSYVPVWNMIECVYRHVQYEFFISVHGYIIGLEFHLWEGHCKGHMHENILKVYVKLFKGHQGQDHVIPGLTSSINIGRKRALCILYPFLIFVWYVQRHFPDCILNLGVIPGSKGLYGLCDCRPQTKIMAK